MIKFCNRGGKFVLEGALNQRDLNKGVRFNSFTCPLALSLGKQVRKRFRRWEDVRIEVGTTIVRMLAKTDDGPRDEFVAIINSNLRAAVEMFDDGGKLYPGTYSDLTFEWNGTE